MPPVVKAKTLSIKGLEIHPETTAHEVFLDKTKTTTLYDFLDNEFGMGSISVDGNITNPIGDITSDNPIENMTIREIIEKMVSPVRDPIVEVVTNRDGFHEIGTNVFVTNMMITVTPQTESIRRLDVYYDGTQVSTRTSVSGFDGLVSFPVNFQVSDSGKVEVIAVSESGSESTHYSSGFEFVLPMFVDVVNVDETINMSAIPTGNVRKILLPKSNVIRTFSPNDRCIVFAYPKEYGLLFKIFADNLNVINSFEVTETLYRGVDYYIYTSHQMLVERLRFQFEFNDSH